MNPLIARWRFLERMAATDEPNRESDGGDAMKSMFTISIRKSVLRALRLLLIDALCGGACGGLYGFIFSGFGAAGRGASNHLLLIAGSFAACGAIAGLLVPASILNLQADDSSADRSPATSGAGTENSSIAAVRPVVTSSHHRPQPSHVAV
jgi:hypothetical protein